jgi:erythromycin esterase-like protein
VGFTTHTGTVIAADDWRGPAERKWLRPALAGCVEDVFHQVEENKFLLRFDAAWRSADALRPARLEGPSG